MTRLFVSHRLLKIITIIILLKLFLRILKFFFKNIFLFIIRSCLIWLKLNRTSCWTSLSNPALHFLSLIPLSPVFLPWLRLHPDKVILWKLIFFNFNIVNSICLFIYTCNCFQELKDWLDIWLCTTSLWL